MGPETSYVFCFYLREERGKKEGCEYCGLIEHKVTLGKGNLKLCLFTNWLQSGNLLWKEKVASCRHYLPSIEGAGHSLSFLLNGSSLS